MAPLPPRHILIVEDSADNRESLQELLESQGHRVDTAMDGEQGVERAIAAHPEVALVDIGLPRLDGYEVARRIRAAGGSDIFLVALTGYGQPEDRTRAAAAGFDVHITKPINFDELHEILSAAPRGGPSARASRLRTRRRATEGIDSPTSIRVTRGRSALATRNRTSPPLPACSRPRGAGRALRRFPWRCRGQVLSPHCRAAPRLPVTIEDMRQARWRGFRGPFRRTATRTAPLTRPMEMLTVPPAGVNLIALSTRFPRT